MFGKHGKELKKSQLSESNPPRSLWKRIGLPASLLSHRLEVKTFVHLVFLHEMLKLIEAGRKTLTER